ncbi:MAG TPA: response regulator [Thermoanaerobaculia bacterium]|nr:response regulator [Thermoanaerobaculia bacterium]
MSPRAEEPVNILTVDDSPEKLLALSAALSELNENVVTASSGREALRQLLKQEFAVVLLDVNMPGLDGFETAALIRQRRSSEHTPIIFITSYGDQSHAGRGYSLGAVDYILAPVDPEILRTKVTVFVELFRKTAEIRRQARFLEQRARQFQRLTQASVAINSALSIDRMLAVVSELARDILGAHQAVAVAAADQKWSNPRTAVSLSSEYESGGERLILRDREALLALLSRLRGTARHPRGVPEDPSPWREFLKPGPAQEGWLAAPLCGRDGRPIGLIHLLDKFEGDFVEEDEAILTQLAQMSAIAIENTLNAEALESNRIKDEFLTTLSHELRTPLSAILGWTRTLRAGRLEDQVAHGLEVIERNVLAQTQLIDDLLDVSRIITGKLRLSVRRASLATIIDAVCEAMRPAADAKEIEISFERKVAPREDIVVGDPDRLQQIVWNLLSNGIKFTPPLGRVAIRLDRLESHFEIRVADTGRGIRPEFLEHVFERFRQADSSTSRTHGGLGIGLAIARHLTELHGGSISAESAGENLGATFVVQLPAVALGLEDTEARRKTLSEPVPRAAREVPDLAGLRVLVVEDEPDTRELLELTLRAAGAEVLSVASAREALEALRAGASHALVSDIGLPLEDGYWLIERVRTLPDGHGADVPALAVSAYVREEDRMRALTAGFQGYLAKPFEPAELVAAVGSLTRRGRPASAGSAPQADRSFGPGEPLPARVLIVEDDRDSREGLRELLQVWGHSVEVARDGTEGIEKAMETQPGVALIDIGLPGLDGYEVAHRIREAFGERPILLVALTGYVDSEDRLRASKSGFDAHLPKPIPIEKLRPLLASAPAGPLAAESPA